MKRRHFTKRAEKDEEEKEKKEDGRGCAWRTSQIHTARTTFMQAPFAEPLQYILKKSLLSLKEIIVFRAVQVK